MGCGSSTEGSTPGGRGGHPGFGGTLFSIHGADIRDPDPNDTRTLQVDKVNLYVLENAKQHHTNEYDVAQGPDPKLVIRRGQCFDVNIQFNRPYNSQDDLRLVFQFGPNPNPGKATHIELVVSEKDEPLSWAAKVIHTVDNQITVRIATPPKLFVGKWSFYVDVIRKDEEEKNTIFRYKHKDKIYMLFNPWCKDDQVYHNEAELLDEYVLNETGKIYQGNKSRINGKAWNFGQFEGNVLDCALYLLETVSKTPPTSRGDPVVIVRKISAIANNLDNNGVLAGNWSGRYSDGTSPMHWSGSVDILEQYYSTKKPVKYGQCWVFSGVVTSLCRTIGIPARSVTNFSSAHDCNGSITIDKFWSPSGDEKEFWNDDSVWNFHVWNDVWMARPDLPEGYGGWQAIDATPQETSEGVYCCGPFPVLACKRGYVDLPYDGAFIFAEVNSDEVHWVVSDEDGSRSKSRLVKDKVGKFISTHVPDCKGMQSISWNCWDTEREDVTNEYKFQEGTQSERASVITANMRGTRTDHSIYDSDQPEDVKFEIVRQQDINYGEDFDLVLKVTNTNRGETRKIGGSISVYPINYTGTKYAVIKKDRFSDRVLEPDESVDDIKLHVRFSEYFDNLTDDCHLELSCMASVTETKQVFTEQDKFQLNKPIPKLEGPEQAKVGVPFNVSFSFTNPLPKSLTKCKVVIEGPGVEKNKTIKGGNIPDIPEGGEFNKTFEFKPAKAGKRNIIITFHSVEMENVGGNYKIEVTEA